MMKSLCCLGSATLGVLLLSACSSDPLPPPDTSVISTGDTNAASTGGYFWTYTDHNTAELVPNSPYHATIDQVTSKTVSLSPFNEGGSHGNVLRIVGQVPNEIPWDLVKVQDPTSIDQYWKKLYPNPEALVPAYPAAGLGFGFRNLNAPFDATGGDKKYIGVAFDMKVLTGTTVVWTSFPMVGSDLPDPSYGDAFPAPGQDGGCKYYTKDNDPATGYSTCFTNYRKGYHDASTAVGNYDKLAAGGTWQRYCTLFSELGVPNWANDGTKANVIPFNPKKVLKMQWDMYQPKTGGPAAYDISVDNIKLITKDEATSNNCDPAKVDASMNPSTVNDES